MGRMTTMGRGLCMREMALDGWEEALVGDLAEGFWVVAVVGEGEGGVRELKHGGVEEGEVC